jgi:broad specificity phosphatase PhoE
MMFPAIMRRRLPLCTLLAWTLLLQACASAPAATAEKATTALTTVIVVRHAEKVDNSEDPALSPIGQARAAALADALRDAGIQAIYTTQYQRTRGTAAPLARLLGLVPVMVETGGPAVEHGRAVAAKVLAQQPGRTVLVVGHSNTVPAIVGGLGAADVGSIADDEYHKLFIVKIAGSDVRLIRARY